MKEFLKRHIREELLNYPLKGSHGINSENIGEFLIEPRLQEYVGSNNHNDIFAVWTVLREYPNQRIGYTVFYDPELESFGLGLFLSNGQLTHIGIYGSFVETISSM